MILFWYLGFIACLAILPTNTAKKEGVRDERGECEGDIQYTVDRVIKGEIWALSMADACSKPPAGILDGRIQDLGNYDQCVRVAEPGGRFVGQYCLVEARGVLPQSLDDYLSHKAVLKDYPGGFVMFSVCVPSSCSSSEVLSHLGPVLKKVGVRGSMDSFEISCSTGQPAPFRTKDWIALGVFGTISLLVVLSTWYELRSSARKSELLTTFSVASNWAILSDTKSPSSDISCLHGLRLICAVSVVFTHRAMAYYFVPYFNHSTYLEQRSSLLWALIFGSGHLGAETFFLITGTVRAYTFLQERHTGKPLNTARQFVLRYFRVFPVMAVTLLFSATLTKHLSQGPLWEKCIGLKDKACSYLWWTNLLLVGNFLNIWCQSEAWFLSVDFQLYLFSLLLLVPLYFRPRLGKMLLAATFFLSTIAKITAVFVFELYPDLSIYEGPKMKRTISLAHSNTVYRAGTFVTGLALGLVLYEAKCGRNKVSLSKGTVWLGWTLAVLVLATTPCVQAVFLNPWTEDCLWSSALFLGFMLPLYATAVAWVVFACTLGHGGWLYSFLSLSTFRPFAKLTFSVYMVHVIVLFAHTFRTRQPIDFNTVDMVYICLGDLVVSLALATVLYLTVETPCRRLVSLLLRQRPRSVSKDLASTYLMSKREHKKAQNLSKDPSEILVPKHQHVSDSQTKRRRKSRGQEKQK